MSAQRLTATRLPKCPLPELVPSAALLSYEVPFSHLDPREVTALAGLLVREGLDWFGCFKIGF